MVCCGYIAIILKITSFPCRPCAAGPDAGALGPAKWWWEHNWSTGPCKLLPLAFKIQQNWWFYLFGNLKHLWNQLKCIEIIHIRVILEHLGALALQKTSNFGCGGTHLYLGDFDNLKSIHFGRKPWWWHLYLGEFETLEPFTLGKALGVKLLGTCPGMELH